MSVAFKTIKWKNFLSTGDKFTEIQLDRSPTTLIVGKNGAGKSTMLDALSFALFGRPHRSINKPQLVNSVNEKQCEVHVEFTIGIHQFKIIRGIKPNIFEIYQDGVMINQNSAVRDYQHYLEQNVLKLNHKSFHQIVVLGSSSFIPFMQLPAHHRRDIIEDLLDINIFSKMNGILKESMGKLRESLSDFNNQIDTIKDKIELQRKYVTDISLLNEEHLEYKRSIIVTSKSELDMITGENYSLQNYISEHSAATSAKHLTIEKISKKLGKYESTFKTEIRGVVKEAKFYDEHENCPTCSQDIDEQFRAERKAKATSRAKDLKDGINKLTIEITETDMALAESQIALNDITAKSNSIIANDKLIKKINKSIDTIQVEIDDISKTNNDVNNEKSKLQEMIELKVELLNKKIEVVEDQRYSTVAQEMLKDTGIKTKIIKQYLPVMNNLINQYLQTMDFFVSFNLDENFNETIKSRHRDQFKYSSFSEGEKARIDLALLFTWRQISTMKNSSLTNLLILDESFDSSMDGEGIGHLTKILQSTCADTNVFVISHRESLEDSSLFKSKIEFVKEGNFSSVA
jgi:DNA repair exonuclease SbcCD ATPase subunit|tara:strand:- start:75 stop:1796 length:1722 start_codon:yes stop_codon:yes gene_type:complete